MDQRFPSITVEAVASPQSGDVGCLGDRVGSGPATVASGQPIVASLGMKDVGQVANVVLAAAVSANGWAEPDQVARTERDLGRLPGDRENERIAPGRAAPADRAADTGTGGSAPGAMPRRSSGSAWLRQYGDLPVAAARLSSVIGVWWRVPVRWSRRSSGCRWLATASRYR